MDIFEFNIDGRQIKAEEGQTIADALLANGIKTCRKTRNQKARGVYCGMGVCHECRMIVDGIPNVRTCITPAKPGMIVAMQHDAGIEVGR